MMLGDRPMISRDKKDVVGRMKRCFRTKGEGGIRLVRVMTQNDHEPHAARVGVAHRNDSFFLIVLSIPFIYSRPNPRNGVGIRDTHQSSI